MILVDDWMMRTIRRALPQGVIDYAESHRSKASIEQLIAGFQ